MSRSGPCGKVTPTVFSELQDDTHRLEEIDTKGARHPIIVDDLYLVIVPGFSLFKALPYLSSL